TKHWLALGRDGRNGQSARRAEPSAGPGAYRRQPEHGIPNTDREERTLSHAEREREGTRLTCRVTGNRTQYWRSGRRDQCPQADGKAGSGQWGLAAGNRSSSTVTFTGSHNQ